VGTTHPRCPGSRRDRADGGVDQRDVRRVPQSARRGGAHRLRGRRVDAGVTRVHQYLKPGQFASVFGPTQATITAARQWLASTGLHVGATTPDGLLLPVTGTVSDMERAFSVSVVNARLPTGRESRFVASAPAVPAALAPSIQGWSA